MLTREYAKLLITSRKELGAVRFVVRRPSRSGHARAASNIFKYHAWVLLANSPFLYLNWANRYNCYCDVAFRTAKAIWLKMGSSVDARTILRKLGA